jgi:hypothetical protein
MQTPVDEVIGGLLSRADARDLVDAVAIAEAVGRPDYLNNKRPPAGPYHATPADDKVLAENQLGRRVNCSRSNYSRGLLGAARTAVAVVVQGSPVQSRISETPGRG